MSKIYLENVWAEDVFEWFYNHIMSSGGDGAGAICCKNYKETANYFLEWFKDEKYKNYPYLEANGLTFFHPVSETDGIINFHDGNENFIFTNREAHLFSGDYSFIIKKDCKFGFTSCSCDKKIEAL